MAPPLSVPCSRRWWCRPDLLVMAALLVLAGCATGAPRGALLAGYRYRSLAPTDFPKPSKATPQTRSDISRVTESEYGDGRDWAEPSSEEGKTETQPPFRSRGRYPPPAGDAPLDGWGEGWAGWPDGVGDGRPHTVPMSLDYFQGFLAHVGVPTDALPVDGRTLSPEDALRLLPHLLSTPVTLGNFAQRRMAAHLLLEVAMGEGPVSRQELHARMNRFHRLLVLRPDGYLVLAITGEAKQKVGEVRLAKDGTLRAGRFEVGPFYALEGGRLWPVEVGLEVPRGALSLGAYAPDDGVLLPVLEGAGLALVDTVEGLYRLVFHPGETLEGLTQLPGAVRELVQNAPEYWDAFRHKPHGERVRDISRLTTSVLLVVGTSGSGAVKAASWGGRLGQFTVPVFSLTGEGSLALRLVAMPGRVVAVAGQALSATFVLHMTAAGAGGAGGNWTPPVGGPGKWEMAEEFMSEEARIYQSQVTGAPRGWVYRVCGNGECVDFDGYNPSDGVLLDAKGLGYDKHFGVDLKPKRYFQGAEGLVERAIKQTRVALGRPIRWHVAEPRMVVILKKLFQEKGINGIEVICTPPST